MPFLTDGIKCTYLVVLVQPEEGEIGDTNRFPMILDLLSCAVDNVGYFVCDDELQVLQHSNHISLVSLFQDNVLSL